jgi:hypothetical protein
MVPFVCVVGEGGVAVTFPHSWEAVFDKIPYQPVLTSDYKGSKSISLVTDQEIQEVK